MIALWLWTGCTVADTDDTEVIEADTDVDSDADADTDTDADTDAPITDIDADGYRSDVDCNDYNPAVYPGAAESWNSKDDDCDGVIDGDGHYAGDATVDATAIYEGTPYSWRLTCPTTLDRADQTFAFAVVCTADPTDAKMVQLLGDTMTIRQLENVVPADQWAGDVEVSSTNDWDARGSGTLRWSAFTATNLSVTLNTTSLRLSGAVRLTR